ncbi:phospholipase D family protein [Paraburkholderia sp. CNPSo 3157]|uniref:Phospholipase D family protein n=1 Tax=Paraburkholderia franconis TaxID=2654983 RepID=A0A7X1N5D9_9BURK|nr:phospholipase D family protein [Paraburkholderia franconis]MPW15662.1 phospholipase D family protein [Paraburkholderia franconis]
MIKLRSLLAAFTVALLTSCASLPPQTDRVATHAVTDTQNTRLANAFTRQEQQHPDESAFHLLPDAVNALVARLVLAQAADRTLDLQYYIWHDDLTGRALGAAVLRAADRGVRVRILLDDLGTNADDKLLLALDSHPNVQIRLFNPVASRTFKKIGMATEFFRVNRRMHNKSMIADNEGAILGGRNIGDEYFGASTDVAFGDLDVLVHGPVVRDVSTAFDLYWNSDASYPIASLMGRKADPSALAEVRAKLDAYLASEETNPYVVNARARLTQVIHSHDATQYSWGKATLLYDDPAKITRSPGNAQGHLMTQLKALHLQPEHQMLVVSPYFVPGKEGVAWLSGLTHNGVRVTVLTNSLAATDVAAVHAGYQRYRRALLEAGVRLYELKPVASEKSGEDKKQLFGSSKASLHAKTYVFDRDTLFIGSMNLDPRSVALNTEIGVYCESAAAASQVVDTLEPILDHIAWRLELRPNPNGTNSIVWIDTAPDGSMKVLDSEPDVSALRKAGIWLLGILPIESQL